MPPMKPRIPIRGLWMGWDDNLTAGAIFVCTRCEKQIEDAEMAMVYWDTNGQYAEVMHKECNLKAGDPYQLSMTLNVEMVYLLHNSGMGDEEEIKRVIKIAEDFASF